MAFNVAPPNKERTLKSLIEKYNKIKQSLRDRAYYFSKDAKKTGGGPSKRELLPLSEPLQELAILLSSSTLGLPAVTGDSGYAIANESNLEYASQQISSPTGQVQHISQPSNRVQHISLGEVIVQDFSFFLDTQDKDANVTVLGGEPTFDCQAGNTQKTEDHIIEPSLSDKGPITDSTWDRVNPAKLKKTINPLLQSQETQLHVERKHQIELEIMLGEKERYQLERDKAATDLKRANSECERAQFERERSIIELERTKLQLETEKEMRIRLSSLPGHYVTEKLSTSTPTAAAKKEYM